MREKLKAFGLFFGALFLLESIASGQSLRVTEMRDKDLAPGDLAYAVEPAAPEGSRNFKLKIGDIVATMDAERDANTAAIAALGAPAGLTNWGENGTNFRPNVTGYQLGETGKEIGNIILSLPSIGTPAAGDLVIIQDADDSLNLKTALFSEFGGSGLVNWEENTTIFRPKVAGYQLGEAGFEIGNIITSGTVDGRNVATDGTKLDGIEALADVTDATNVAAAGAVMDSDISAAEGFLRKTGAGAYEAIKSNLAAAVDPTVNEDSGDGYAVGSIWINTTLDKGFVCLDATVAGAVWTETTGAGGGGLTNWEESGTILQPKVAGYDLGEEGNGLGIITIGDNTDANHTLIEVDNLSDAPTFIWNEIGDHFQFSDDLRINGNDLEFAGGQSGMRLFGNNVYIEAAGTDVWWSEHTVGHHFQAAGSGAEVVIALEADHVWSQRNATNAQTFRLYNTYTDASNYERGGLKWDTDKLYLFTDSAGTGTNRNIWISTPGALVLDAAQVYQQTGGTIRTELISDDFRPYVDSATGLGSSAKRWEDLWVDTIDVQGAITARELSADPANPDEGAHVIWQSDGVGTGDDGDVLIKTTAGAVTKTATIYDHSTGTVGGGGGGAFTADAATQITPSTAIVLDEATGDEIALDLSYTVNKATSGNDTGLKMNMTDTASPGTSLLMDLQVGGVRQASVRSNGAGYFDGGVYIFSDDTNWGLEIGGSQLSLKANGGRPASWSTAAAGIRSTMYRGWSSTTNPYDTADVRLYRDDASILAQRNATNAQTFRLYDTYTDASNYARGALSMDGSGNLTIATEAAGTGTAGNIYMEGQNGYFYFGTAADADAGGKIEDRTIQFGTSALAGARNIAIGYATTANKHNGGGTAIGQSSSAGSLEARGTAIGSNSVAEQENSFAAVTSTTFADASFAFPAGYTERSNLISSRIQRNVQTTDATSAVLRTDTETSTIVLPDQTTLGFTGIVTARRTDADNESAAWSIEGCIDRNGATTALVGTPAVSALGDDSAGTWTVAVTANDTNDTLDISVTGEAAKTIKWTASIMVNGYTE